MPLDYSISKLFQGTDTDDNDRTVNTVNIDLHVIGVKNIPSFLLSVERLLVVLIDELSRNKKKKERIKTVDDEKWTVKQRENS